MWKIYKKPIIISAGIIVATCLLFFAVAPKAQAWTGFKASNNSYTVGKNQTINNSLWLASKNIVIAGTVNGDVFCGSQNVDISGTINGDVICGGQTVDVSGRVNGNLRIAAQTINLSGIVSRNVSLLGQTINTDSRSRVAQDASLAGTDLNLNGTIGRDLAAGGTNLNLNGVVGRDVTATAEQINLAPSANVGGGITYTSKNKIQIASGANVAGQVTQHIPTNHYQVRVNLALLTGFAAVLFSLFLLVSAVVITAIFPQLVHQVSGRANKNPLLTLLVGFVASIVVPVAIIVLMISVVGIPIALLALVAWVLVAALSGLFTSYYVGRLILGQHQKNAVLRVLLGGAIVLLLSLLPFIGFVVMVVSFWLGSGMILMELKTHYRKPRYGLE